MYHYFVVVMSLMIITRWISMMYRYSSCGLCDPMECVWLL